MTVADVQRKLAAVEALAASTPFEHERATARGIADKLRAQLAQLGAAPRAQAEEQAGRERMAQERQREAFERARQRAYEAMRERARERDRQERAAARAAARAQRAARARAERLERQRAQREAQAQERRRAQAQRAADEQHVARQASEHAPGCQRATLGRPDVTCTRCFRISQRELRAQREAQRPRPR